MGAGAFLLVIGSSHCSCVSSSHLIKPQFTSRQHGDVMFSSLEIFRFLGVGVRICERP